MYQSLKHFFPEEYREKLGCIWEEKEEIREIRIRAGKPTLYMRKDGEQYALYHGKMIIFGQEDLKKMIYHICNYSVYAFEEEQKQGYMTLQGGHRLGIAGKVNAKGDKIINFQTISGFHFRIAHEMYGIADSILPYLYENGVPVGLMIISPPGFGKTTLLREIIRNMSNGTTYGRGINITVIDERSEIGGCFQGKCENDLGVRTDILDGCPKVVGMMMAIRALTPDMIAVDEIGGADEIETMLKAVYCGVGFLLTAHGESLEDVEKRFEKELLINGKIKRFLIIQKENYRNHYQIYNEERQLIYVTGVQDT